MAVISVIVPVYNVEKYLEKCIDSILFQTFKEFELILIDDGSEDNSLSICKRYAKQDARIRYISQANSGPGKTRNVGIDLAKGEFILFIDSDDYIAENMLEILYRHVKKGNVDIATCGLYNVYRQRCVPQCDVAEEFMCDNVKAFGLLLIGEKIPGSSCNKLIKSELLKSVGYPEGVVYEDVGFHTRLMQKVKTVYVDTTPLYYYVHRENSITTKEFDSQAMMFIYSYEEVLSLVERKYPEILTEARFKLFWAYFAILDRILQVNNYKKVSEYKQVKSYLKRNTIRILRNPYFHKTRKLGALVLLINTRFYRILTKMNEKKIKKLFS